LSEINISPLFGAMNAPKHAKLLELEGLRGLAALFVVLSHLSATFFRDDFQRFYAAILTWLWPFNVLVRLISTAPFNGRFSVWVFWTLSGFALSYRFFVLRDVEHSARSRFYLLDAALRRFPRLLLPVVVATLFSYALLKLGLMANKEVAQTILPNGQVNTWLASAYDFTPRFRDALTSAFWTTFFSPHVLPVYDPPLWTMKRELLGSFFIFGFLALFGRVSWRWSLYLTAGLVFIVLHQIWIDAFVAGIVLCDLRVNHLEDIRRRASLRLRWVEFFRRSHVVAVAGVLALLALIGYCSQRTIIGVDSDPQADISYIFLAFLAILLVQFSAPIKAVLSNAFWAFIGKISFGIYICHFPFIMSFSCRFYSWLEPQLGHVASAWITGALTLPCVIGLGTVFYWIADGPSIPFSRYVASHLLCLARIPAGR
jgi:peptidoglycan/LPS O-acetylase OafA/YrhL